jgi:hypothetical protein
MLSIPFNAVLPRVEDPFPDTIGVGVIFSIAGAGGVVGFVAGSMLGASDVEPDLWTRRGVSFGFTVGTIFYAAALVVQVL